MTVDGARAKLSHTVLHSYTTTARDTAHCYPITESNHAWDLVETRKDMAGDKEKERASERMVHVKL